MWDDWSAIEAAQARADAEDAQRRAEDARRRREKAEAPSNPTPAPVVEEASRLAWPDPILPTDPGVSVASGRQPTNPDGSSRHGSWRGGVWEDRPPLRVADMIRLWARRVAEVLNDPNEQ